MKLKTCQFFLFFLYLFSCASEVKIQPNFLSLKNNYLSEYELRLREYKLKLKEHELKSEIYDLVYDFKRELNNLSHLITETDEKLNKIMNLDQSILGLNAIEKDRNSYIEFIEHFGAGLDIFFLRIGEEISYRELMEINRALKNSQRAKLNGIKMQVDRYSKYIENLK